MTLTEWQKKTALPSLLLSLLFTLSFVVPIYWFPVDGTIKTLCTVINYGTWVLFAADYVYQIKLAPNNIKYLKTHIFELLLVVGC